MERVTVVRERKETKKTREFDEDLKLAVEERTIGKFIDLAGGWGGFHAKRWGNGMVRPILGDGELLTWGLFYLLYFDLMKR